MAQEIEADEIAQFVNKTANYDTPTGVSITVEFDDGTTMNREWGAVEATSEPTPETTIETPERNEAEIRDAWAKISDTTNSAIASEEDYL